MLFLRATSRKLALGLFLISWSLIPTMINAQTTANIDLVVEAQTYVPYFYAGRAEPTAGNNVRLIALSGVDGATSFSWKIGNNYLSSEGPVISTKLPLVSERILVEVTALTENGSALARGSEYIAFSEPELLFYEDNALRGIVRVALFKEFIMSGNEMSIRAEPYFAGQETLSNFRASWTSNLSTELSPEDWRYLYVTRDDNPPSLGQIKLDVMNPTNLNEFLSTTLSIKL